MKIKILFLTVIFLCLPGCGKAKLTGEVYFVGDRGIYRFSNVPLKIFRQTRIDEIEKRGDKASLELLKADFELITDSEGKFSLNIPSGDYVAFVLKENKVPRETEKYTKIETLEDFPDSDLYKVEKVLSTDTEKYEWQVPFTVSGETNLTLSNQNATRQ